MKFKKIIQIFVSILCGSLYNIKAMNPNTENKINIEHLPTEIIREILTKIADPDFIDKVSQANIDRIKAMALLRKDEKKVPWKKEVTKVLEALKKATYNYLNQFENSPEELVNRAMELNTEFSRSYLKNLINADSKKYNAKIAEVVNDIFKKVFNKVQSLGYWTFTDAFKKTIFLISVGADPNIRNYRKYDINTPLLWAVEGGQKYLTELLLNNPKTDPNIRNNSGQTALIEAVKRDYGIIVKLLLRNNKTDPNIKDYNGDTPLAIAVQENYKDIVKFLLKNSKTDPNIKGSNGYFPLEIAIMFGKEDIVRLLLKNKKTDPNIKGIHEVSTPLGDAVIRNLEDIVKLLLKNKRTDPNIQDMDGRTVLMIAAEYGKKNIVKLLLNNSKTNPNIRNNKGKTALKISINKGHKEITDLIKDYSKKFNEKKEKCVIG